MKKHFVNIFLFIFIIVFTIVINFKKDNNLNYLSAKFNDSISKIENSNIAKENQELKDLTNIKDNYKARAIAKGYFSSLYSTYLINVGEKDNIQKDYLVLNSDKLIGIISSVKKYYSVVTLLVNTKKEFSVRINDIYGILKAQNQQLQITGFSSKDIKVGDEVFTSGLTKIPSNIYIGRVSKIDENDLEFKTVAYINNEKSYQNYKYIMVLGE